MFSRIFGAWRRVVRDVATLELWQVLRRRGTRRLADVYPPALASAVERCTECRHLAECRRLLAADWDSGIDAFCPNAMYLQHLDAMKGHQAATAKPSGLRQRTGSGQ